MKKINKYLGFSSFLAMFFIFSFSCDREKDLEFNDFDKNNDGLIAKKEFKKVFTKNYYDDWNRKDNEYLDDEDFLISVYQIWDVDDDELLSEEEWIKGYDYYYGNFVLTDYESIDVDNDGFIEYTEFDDALSDTEFFVSWDVDASEYLTQEELATNVFNLWDIDKSNTLEKDEFNEFDEYYLDV
jgi:Ca2+-binding EF-hand superfamily protein